MQQDLRNDMEVAKRYVWDVHDKARRWFRLLTIFSLLLGLFTAASSAEAIFRFVEINLDIIPRVTLAAGALSTLTAGLLGLFKLDEKMKLGAGCAGQIESTLNQFKYGNLNEKQAAERFSKIMEDFPTLLGGAGWRNGPARRSWW